MLRVEKCKTGWQHLALASSTGSRNLHCSPKRASHGSLVMVAVVDKVGGGFPNSSTYYKGTVHRT